MSEWRLKENPDQFNRRVTPTVICSVMNDVLSINEIESSILILSDLRAAFDVIDNTWPRLGPSDAGCRAPAGAADVNLEWIDEKCGRSLNLEQEGTSTLKKVLSYKMGIKDVWQHSGVTRYL